MSRRAMMGPTKTGSSATHASHAGLIIEADAISKSFDTENGALLVLDRLSLAVHPGEFVAVTGEPGSGCSTLLRCLAGCEEPDAGSVKFAGAGIGIPPVNRPGCAGIVAETDDLLPLTLFENVELPLTAAGHDPRLARSAAVTALGIVDLAHAASLRPADLDACARRRATLARAIVGLPLLLIVDEPTSRLDPGDACGIVDILRRLHERGMTLVVATRDPAILADATRVLVLSGGRLAEPRA